MSGEETIFALASGAGRAGIAVIRLSGPAAGKALERLSGGGLPVPRQATRTSFQCPKNQDTVLDDGLALWFPAPASFTGEDVAELHIHGGPAVIGAIVSALAGLPGLRPAEAGEFSRRAFENGKFDLTAAEGLADLIDAETDAQRRQAQRQSRGELGRLYDNWAERLIRAQALSEADIDFSDEDIPDDLIGEALAIAAELDQEIAAHLDDGHRGERLRAGLYLAIVGPPNAGKSSLLNRLAKRDAAIVSDIAGTTRDVIDVHLDLGGYPVIVADTAGLREARDSIETEGVRRARERAGDADMKLAVFDATDLDC
ncbi:MAG: tRNA uridine-5-carboxymethylaminomethyl(34) synthesis GTPase MnmE, partial [Rhodospirillales bacterium]|nr:tRNA uridine-5-carboxymethylaminomethyl(34) synthesis GTPase MnmE [Rhodospirillales bacterium]